MQEETVLVEEDTERVVERRGIQLLKAKCKKFELQ